MLLIEVCNLKKYFQERKIIDIEQLKIYTGDRLGIVGLNGAGKTTFVRLLAGVLTPDSGYVRCTNKGTIGIINQLDDDICEKLARTTAAQFGIAAEWKSSMSGGEKTRFKIAKAFEQDSSVLIADEPTSNLDIEGIEQFERRIQSYRGALLLISHDRELLDRTCTKILELEDGKLKIYNGNYSSYKLQKQAEFQRSKVEYDSYNREKRRLATLVNELQFKSRHMNASPKRMGNSEARLHKLGNQRAEKNVDRAAKQLESRISRLEVKERPKEIRRVIIDALSTDELNKRVLVSCREASKQFHGRVLFEHVDFDLYNGTKTALIGPNGCGKTTLLRMLLNSEPCFKTAEKLKLGYFSQELEILDAEKTILENVMETSVYTEPFARTILSRILFSRSDLSKKVYLLSGGEKVKASFAKIFLQDINMLVMDEPTNYLDVFSLEAVEQAFSDYDRTLLFVSHDRHFISEVADRLLIYENQRFVSFHGGYLEYVESKKRLVGRDSLTEVNENRIFVLQNKLSELIGRISLPGKHDNKLLLEEEYQVVLRELNALKANRNRE